MVALNDSPAEELVSKLKESVNKRHIIIGGVACVFIAIAIIAAIVGVTYIITWVLAYLWNVGIVPFGAPVLTWWQVTAIWILVGLGVQVIKKIFRT
jgi:predicted RND superfamily exporter protein